MRNAYLLEYAAIGQNLSLHTNILALTAKSEDRERRKTIVQGVTIDRPARSLPAK